MMIRILICCGGGFSSSYVAERMKREVRERHLEDEVMLDFFPFVLVDEKKDNFDVVFCCPHLKMAVTQYLSKKDPGLPLYLIPPRMYGRMELDEIIQDAKDIVDLYKRTHMNPVHFPGEENLLRIRRYQAYRHVVGDPYGNH